jgi:hypothetical protein
MERSEQKLTIPSLLIIKHMKRKILIFMDDRQLAKEAQELKTYLG